VALPKTESWSNPSHPHPLHRMPNARLNGRVAQRLKRSPRRAAPPAFQDGTWIRLGLDRQRNRQAAALFANQLECLATHQGDARFNSHVKFIHSDCNDCTVKKPAVKNLSKGRPFAATAQNPGSCCAPQCLSAFNPNGRLAKGRLLSAGFVPSNPVQFDMTSHYGAAAPWQIQRGGQWSRKAFISEHLNCPAGLNHPTCSSRSSPDV
jgi:hypothetical protein